MKSSLWFLEEVKVKAKVCKCIFLMGFYKKSSHGFCEKVFWILKFISIFKDKVDIAEEFPKVLKHVNEWIDSRGLGTDYKFATATDGPWDMQNFLNLQCSLSKIDYPRWARKWIDIRRMFSNHLGVKRCNILKMLAYFNCEFEGNQHCGLDDAKNIARILLRLAADGCEIKINSNLKKCLSQTDEAKKTTSDEPTNESEQSDAESLEYPEE